MTGALWALSAGVGFGIFQSINRRAVHNMDVYVATFLQLLVSAVVLAAASLLTTDLSLLTGAPVLALLEFSLAGFLHFFIGWTFLNASQKRIGAARTSSLIATTPLFGAIIAALSLQEVPGAVTVAAILLIVGGVYLVNELRPSEATAYPSGWRALSLGLAAALCWSISPIFIRLGLAGLPSPLLGVTVGIGVSTLGYGAALALRSRRASLGRLDSGSFLLKFVAGLLVGLSTWMRWVALDLAPVAVVLAISLVSVPVVNLLSPVVSGRQLETVTLPIWVGSSLVVSGSLVLILLR